MIDAATAQTNVAQTLASYSKPTPTEGNAPSQGQGQNQGEAKSDVRLFIEQDPATHTYVYRLVDSVTGDVLLEIPREQLSTFVNSRSGAAGALIGTTA